MRVKDVLLLFIIILIGLTINHLLKLQEDYLPSFFQIGAKTYHFEEIEEMRFAKGGNLDIHNRHGDIELIPWNKEAIKVELEKVIFSNDEELAREFSKKIHLRLKREKERAIITTNRQEVPHRGLSIQTHMKIMTPHDLFTSITLEHGELSISDIRGDFKMEAHHADLKMKNIAGNIFIQQKHGNLLLESIEGSVRIQQSYGESSLLSIQDDLILQIQHGSAVIKDILKDLSVTSSHSRLDVENIKGGFEADCQHTEILAQKIEGDATIRNNHKDISLSHIVGRLKIESKHSDIKIEGAGSDVEVLAEYGSISIGIPSKQSFSVNLLAKNGDIESDFDLLRPIEVRQDSLLIGSIGEDGPLYQMETSYHDISLEKLSSKK